MSSPFPESIDAGVVALQRRRLSDVPELLVAIEASIAELGAFLSWAAGGVPTPEMLGASITTREADFEAGVGFEYVLREVATGEVVGEAGGEVRDGGASVDVGYWLRSDRTGRGYATSAAAALTTMVFDILPELARVEIRMDKGNTRSRGVPARLGFDLVGEESFGGERLPGQTGEGHVWAVSRGRWRDLRT
jgi:ribosomal-protein-serine acetyltransferase